MKAIPLGEGQKSFPYFFLSVLLLSLVLDICLAPVPSPAQKSEKDELSPFDRLAEEATLLNKRGQYDRVISLLEPQSKDPKNDSALFYNELGMAYSQRGKLKEAIQACREAQIRDPENPVVINNLGYIYYLNKEYSRAVEQYEKAIRLAPRFKEVYSNLSLAYFHMQKYEEALQEIELALKLDPNYDAAKKFRETILKKLGEKK
jgi:tetratricopeptide (TPR) repeat protein